MTRIKDRRKAIKLRKQGKTYSQIRKELVVSKSTLSNWLSDYSLTKKQSQELQKNRLFNKHIAIEKTRIVKQGKRLKRIESTYHEQKTYWGKLSKRELEVAGLFLYWGEGSKRLNGSVSISNTDPMVMKFALFWLKNSLNVSEEKIKIDLHLYSDMNVNKEIYFWSKELNMLDERFRKPYIKKSSRVNIDHKGYGHGTCTLVVNDVLLKEKIMMGIKSIADFYGEKI